ncbi:MAG: hypothetical protein OXT73_05620, partial [Bacteroidota bacterium]|nr:hypothetical protein [Bacteroidota bacterium]
MVPRRLLFVLMCFVLPLMVHAQGLQDWTAHTSFGSANDLMVTNTETWVATEGGVYAIEHATGAITRFTAVDGLSNVGAAAIAADTQRDAIWVGYPDGLLDRIDASSSTIRTYRDIERADQYPSRGINRIRIEGDSVFVATQFGVVVFDPARNEVRDSYDRFGSLPAGIEVNDTLIESEIFGTRTLWIATDEGVAWAPLDGSNLKDPGSWTAETRSGLVGREALALSAFSGSLYVGTDNDLFVRSGPAEYSALGVTNRPVTALTAGADALIGSATFTILVVRPDGTRSAHSVSGFGFPEAVAFGSGSSLWVADGRSGVARMTIPTAASGEVAPLETFLPSGPADGTFSLISISDEGQVWLSGVNASGTGFYRLDQEGAWTTWSSTRTSELAGKGAFVHVHAASDESGWAGSEGGGVAHVAV